MRPRPEKKYKEPRTPKRRRVSDIVYLMTILTAFETIGIAMLVFPRSTESITEKRVLKKFPEKNIFCGHDELFLSASAVGVQAGIGSTFNFMAEKFVKIQKLLAENNWAEAALIQDEANAVIEELCKIGVFKGVKAALKLQGMDCGECRKPFQPLRNEQAAELEQVLRENHCL